MSNDDNLKPGIIGSYCISVARLFKSYGLDAEALFNSVGIDIALADEPGFRFSVEQLMPLWRIAVEKTNNTALGIEVANFTELTSFYSLGISTLASNNLLEVLERYARFSRVVSDGFELVLLEDGEFFELCVLNCLTDQCDEAYDACLSTILKNCRQVSSESFSPSKVEMERIEPKDSDKFDAFFRAPIVFSSNRTCMRFNRRDLYKKLPNANENLARYNDELSVNYLVENSRDSWGEKVFIKLLRSLPGGVCSEVQIAETLGVSRESLQRHLRKEGVSFRKIINDVRFQLAVNYLGQKQLSLEEIAVLLGFSDLSNFYRAFKRWTGKTPRQYQSDLFS